MSDCESFWFDMTAMKFIVNLDLRAMRAWTTVKISIDAMKFVVKRHSEICYEQRWKLRWISWIWMRRVQRQQLKTREFDTMTRAEISIDTINVVINTLFIYYLVKTKDTESHEIELHIRSSNFFAVLSCIYAAHFFFV